MKKTSTRTRRWTSISGVPVIAGIVALVAVPLSAAPFGAQDAEAPEKREKEITAEIVDVDVQTGTLTVKALDAEAGEIDQSDEYTAEPSGEAMKGQELTLVVNEDTRLTEDGGHLVALADLRPGERVNVVYEMNGDEMRVLGVDKSSTTETSAEMPNTPQMPEKQRAQEQQQQQQQTQTQQQHRTAEPATTQQRNDDDAQFFAGVVLEVDQDAGLVRVEEASLDAEKQTFAVDADTELMKETRSIDLASVAIGDPVSIDYEVAAGGDKVARSIEVLTVPPTVE